MSWNCKVVFGESDIEGRGAFAAEPIKAGTKIWTVDEKMLVLPGPDAMLRLPKPLLRDVLHGGYLHHPSDSFVWYTDGMQFVNHGSGSRANIGITAWTPIMEDNCTALRDIEPGEELLEDYTFWSITQLGRDHWLWEIYETHHPDHLAFLLGLETPEAAAAQSAA